MRDRQAARGELAGMMDDFRSRMRAIGAVARQRAQITATATTADETVAVTVNADGQVIGTRFFGEFRALTPEQLGAAVTAVAQAAADDAARQLQELLAPLADERARQPKLSDLISGIPDLEAERPPVPSARIPLGYNEAESAERLSGPLSEVADDPDGALPNWQFDDTGDAVTEAGSEVSDRGWG
ncbi:YbaB/EbfC family nucleoid-associated protein [Nocardia sp. NPDC051832]|uniref:YbaB/EbfC family nucleoid-associated protein n=1 Tax=Nocardia sp. NPDC051832 TaxID=3155673 RepID=UPI00341A2DE3